MTDHTATVDTLVQIALDLFDLGCLSDGTGVLTPYATPKAAPGQHRKLPDIRPTSRPSTSPPTTTPHRPASPAPSATP